MDLKREILKSFAQSIKNNFLGLRLQKRDYKIFRFLLDQKFSSLEMIYLLFFNKGNPEDQILKKNLWTTRQRLSKLRKRGLVKTQKVFTRGKAHYLLTQLGFRILQGQEGEDFPVRNTHGIDFSLYEHDFRLNMIRVFLEVKKKCSFFFSEKWVRAAPLPISKNGFRFARDLFPDAVFINSKNERVALELEVSRKASLKVIQKIHQYERLLSGRYGSSQVLDKIWVVATKKSVIKIYQQAIGRYSKDPTCYRVDHYENIIPKALHE